ncbi:low molecular weight protein-tyrosine-phosphatase [Roseibium sp.]|uniref:low molecular weight protein-tyrosine-phosphatase n=1 Tax=Roseibium sp. TaxID=1936156 RepID=UPI003A972D0B
MTSVLFVCLGNICRSPLAEGIFRETVKRAGIEGKFQIASAGTGAWHVGNPPDPRSIAIADANGIDISRQRAQQVQPADFQQFDFILAMDTDNLAALTRLHKQLAGTRPRLFLQDPPAAVPDPYYGGEDGFETVFQLISQGSLRLLDEVRPNTRSQ